MIFQDSNSGDMAWRQLCHLSHADGPIKGNYSHSDLCGINKQQEYTKEYMLIIDYVNCYKKPRVYIFNEIFFLLRLP